MGKVLKMLVKKRCHHQSQKLKCMTHIWKLANNVYTNFRFMRKRFCKQNNDNSLLTTKTSIQKTKNKTKQNRVVTLYLFPYKPRHCRRCHTSNRFYVFRTDFCQRSRCQLLGIGHKPFSNIKVLRWCRDKYDIGSGLQTHIMAIRLSQLLCYGRLWDTVSKDW